MSPLTAARSAAARRAEHGFSYSKLMHAQNQAGIVIDRKILSEIAVYEPCVMAPPWWPPTAALHPSREPSAEHCHAASDRGALGRLPLSYASLSRFVRLHFRKSRYGDRQRNASERCK